MAKDIRPIAIWLQPKDILLEVEVSDRQDALRALAAAVGRAHGQDAEPIFRALWRREQAGSTALGGGFAIPHARIAGIAQPATLYMRTARPVPFDAPDHKPVSSLLGIVVPEDGARDDHLQLLALVAKLFSDDGFCTQLGGAPDAAAAADAFRSGAARVVSGVS